VLPLVRMSGPRTVRRQPRGISSKDERQLITVAIATPLDAEPVTSLRAPELAREVLRTFAAARFSGAQRQLRRLAEVAEIENDNIARTRAAAKEIEV
jgi:hypothetical protein